MSIYSKISFIQVFLRGIHLEEGEPHPSEVTSVLRGIAPTRNYNHFLKIGFVFPGAGFIPIISTKGINQIKKGKL